MMMQTESVTYSHKVRALRTAIVVGRDPDDRVLDLIAEAGNYDVVVIAQTASAYSQIKRTSPDMIVACVAFDDAAAFQLMSMLKLDRDTARIPLITCLAEPVAVHSDV
jgi:PleD family two-component response regulator